MDRALSLRIAQPLTKDITDADLQVFPSQPRIPETTEKYTASFQGVISTDHTGHNILGDWVGNSQGVKIRLGLLEQEGLHSLLEIK